MSRVIDSFRIPDSSDELQRFVQLALIDSFSDDVFVSVSEEGCLNITFPGAEMPQTFCVKVRTHLLQPVGE